MNRFHDALSDIVNGPSEVELAMRANPVRRVKDSGGVNIGDAVWRAELNYWCTRDDRWGVKSRATTYARAESLVRRQRLCSTREEAARCR